MKGGAALASGTFQTSKTTAAGSGYPGYVICSWSSTNNASNNTSRIDWSLKGGSDYSSTTWYTMTGPVKLTINGTVVYSKADRFQMKKNKVFASGSTTVSHSGNGTKSVSVKLEAAVWSYSINCTYSGTIVMTPNPVYNLSISAGTGSNAYVYRTYSPAGGHGNMYSGTKNLYYGDTLKISFLPSSNYSIDKHTVNGYTFTSDNTHTVSGNVSVVATAIPLKSTIGATDANIESISTITVRRYNSAYTHTITYKFKNLSGTIATKTTDTSIAWKVPFEFYAQIPEAKSDICTLICTTYNGTTNMGSTTCTFKVTASSDLCAPVVEGSLEDINVTTLSLTGDKNKLIRYKSTAKCTITATAKNAAHIVLKRINGESIDGDYKIFTNVSEPLFSFQGTDSRGYSSFDGIISDMIEYVPLTINPIISRPTPTGSDIVMTFSGNYYNGSFGAAENSLRIKFRYKASDETVYSPWEEVNSTSFVIGSSTYSTPSAISLGEAFDYHKSYTFQVQAVDGTQEHPLTTISKVVDVAKGEPVFDWGENDFNFHVPISIQGEKVSDFIIETGVADGIWTYRKWSSGYMECWGTISKQIEFKKIEGFWVSESGNRVETPIPHVHNAVINIADAWAFSLFGGPNDNAFYFSAYYPAINGNPQPNGLRTFNFAVTVFGTWK